MIITMKDCSKRELNEVKSIIEFVKGIEKQLGKDACAAEMNGEILKNLLIDYWRKIHQMEGYVEIETPIILNRRLWETSGHWDHYRENMYTTTIDDEDYAIIGSPT